MDLMKRIWGLRFLDQVVSRQRIFARNGPKESEKASIKRLLDDPYRPDRALEPEDNGLFVGREDLMQQLKGTLDRGSHRPILFLGGERWMGKTSVLKHLQVGLGNRYLVVIHDWRQWDIFPSTPTLLGSLAEEIYSVTNLKGIPVKKLQYASLKEASEQNDAVAYYMFDEWLRDIEHMLAYGNYTLLLVFDDFEKLEDTMQREYFNLELLLDWFRSTNQNCPRVALLFSGIRTLGEMKANWASYFMNSQLLKVGFLPEGKAHNLISKPTPNHSFEEIFGQEVIEEIVRATGCHPFLLQAVCSMLVNILNSQRRNSAEVGDVAEAVNKVLEKWWDTYFLDLWKRTDQDQRVCLSAIGHLDRGNLQEIAKQCEMSEKTVSRVLQTLLRRDLVVYEQQNYHISVPVFKKWVEDNLMP